MSVRIELARSPIVEVVFDGTVTDDEFRLHLDELTRLVAKVDGNVLVYDARRSAPPSPRQRQMQAEWMRANEATIRRTCAGTAFVISSSLIRGALTAILWLQPLATEHKIVATPEEAFAWARERIQKRKPELRRYA